MNSEQIRKRKEANDPRDEFSRREGSLSKDWNRADGKPKTEFLWLYISLVVVLIALLAFLFVPAARQRIQERLDIVFSRQTKPEGSAPVPPTLPVAMLSSTTTLAETATAEKGASPSMIYKPVQVIPRGSDRARMDSLPGGTAEEREPVSVDREPAASRRAGTPPRLGRQVSVPSGGTEGKEERKSSAGKQGTAQTDSAVSAAGQTAFKILLDKVPAMAALHGNSLAGMQFSSWKAVKEEDPEIWIAVIGRRADDNQEESFIWKVNISDLSVLPLSQAARRVVTEK